MIFPKEPSTSYSHNTSMISVNKIWYLYNDTNVTVVDFNKFGIRVRYTYSFTKDKYSKEQQ